MATVAVTGAEGFLGRHLATRLEADGDSVISLDLLGPPPAVDVRLPIDPELLRGADAVVHLAALTGIASSLERPTAFEHTNVDGTARVVDAAVEAGVPRLVLVSSSAVYGECAGPVSESSPVRPLSPYGRTKLASEQAATSRSREIEVAIVRVFSAYGPGQRQDMVISRLLSGEQCTLWTFVRDFTFVDEVVDGIVAAIDTPLEHSGEVFNLGSGRPVSANALLHALATVMGRRPAVEWGPARSSEAHRTWADMTKSRERLQVQGPMPLLDGLAQQMNAGGSEPIVVADSTAWSGTATSTASESTPRS